MERHTLSVHIRRRLQPFERLHPLPVSNIRWVKWCKSICKNLFKTLLEGSILPGLVVWEVVPLNCRPVWSQFWVSGFLAFAQLGAKEMTPAHWDLLSSHEVIKMYSWSDPPRQPDFVDRHLPRLSADLGIHKFKRSQNSQNILLIDTYRTARGNVFHASPPAGEVSRRWMVCK